MKRTAFRTFIVFLMLVLTTVLMGPLHALAEDGSAQEFEVSGSKTASPTELDSSQRETTVTLSLPSGEYQNMVDIVFVMDNSTSVANANLDFSGYVQDLLDRIVEENEGVDLKVAVVKFRGFATDMLGTGLTPYSGNEDAIVAAIANNSVPGSGSNVHSGLVMAEELLSADTEVPDSNKYVVMLTDCKSYIWNNEANEPTTYYAQYFSTRLQNSGRPMLNQWAGMYTKEQGQLYATLPQITDHEPFNMLIEMGTYSAAGAEDSSEYYQLLYDTDNAEIAATDTKYDAPCYYSKYYPEGSYTGTATPGDGEIVARPLTNGASIFNINGQQRYHSYYDYTPQEGTFWVDVNYLQLNPYDVIQNEDGTYSYDTSSVNEDFWMWHPSAMEKGIYQAGHYWSEVIDAQYNTACIATYKGSDGTGSHICGSFRTWLSENSDMYADVNDYDAVLALFEDIDDSIRFMVSKGVVTDTITDDFELKNADSADAFRMTRNGEALAVTFADGVWSFGEAVDGVYPYVISYDASTKTITWEINVPIENLKPVTLSYDLILREDAEPGVYPTNVEAVLDYTSTDGTKDGSFTFEVPEVTYVKLIDIEVKKTWDDADDQDGLRPESVTVHLLANGEDTGEALELSEANGWEGVFEGVPSHDAGEEIAYTVEEDTPEGYEATITETAEHSFAIENVHEPEPIPEPEPEPEPTPTPTPKPAPKPAVVPKTGDPFGFASIASLGVMGASAVVAGMVARRRKH